MKINISFGKKTKYREPNTNLWQIGISFDTYLITFYIPNQGDCTSSGKIGAYDKLYE